MKTIAPDDSDLWDETSVLVGIAKTKPINFVESSGIGDRWGGSGQGDGNTT